MSTVTLEVRRGSQIPVEADCMTPAALDSLTAAGIERLTVWAGNQQEPLGEYFAARVEGEGEVTVLRLEGDCSHVKWIGKGLFRGRVEVHGPAGMHLGAYQSGGEIECFGDAGDWASAMMKGGLLRIHGSAGHLLGAAYRGDPVGMKDGVILVHGNAGNDVGAGMGRGLIVVLGDVGDTAGVAMHAGTILCGGNLGIRPGAMMMRGSVIGLGKAELLPTFSYSCTYTPPYLRLLARKLAKLGVGFPSGALDGEYRLYAGDMAVLGKGEVLLWNRTSA